MTNRRLPLPLLGRDYAVELFGTPVDAATSNETATVTSESGGTIRVRFAGSVGRVTTAVRLAPTDP